MSSQHWGTCWTGHSWSKYIYGCSHGRLFLSTKILHPRLHVCFLARPKSPYKLLFSLQGIGCHSYSWCRLPNHFTGKSIRMDILPSDSVLYRWKLCPHGHLFLDRITAPEPPFVRVTPIHMLCYLWVISTNIILVYCTCPCVELDQKKVAQKC